MKNMDIFNETSVRLFRALHGHFPEKIRLENKLPKNDSDAAVVAGTIEWWRDNGYIRCHSESDGSFDNAVLTEKGLCFFGPSNPLNRPFSEHFFTAAMQKIF